MNTPDTEEQKENRESGENGSVPTPAPEPIPEPTYAPEPITIPARMLNEFVYCPRLCYLEWVQGEFEDSYDTVEGRYVHRRVDRPEGTLDPESEGAEEQVIRSIHLTAPEAGLTCRIDLIEQTGTTVVPVDYKKGRLPDLAEGAWEADRVQLCAQMMVLRENGYTCDHGIIYYAGSKKRVTVPMDPGLEDRTAGYIAAMRAMVETQEMPLPLVDSPRCPRCSLVGICLPDEINFLREGGDTHKMPPRMLIPPGETRMPVYVVGQGHMIRKKSEELVISYRGEKAASTRLRDISHLSVYGGVEITTPAMSELLQRGIPVCYFSHGGWFYGIASGHHHKNVELRILQYRTAASDEGSLGLARQFIRGKIKNCRTLLRRNDPGAPDDILARLAGLADQAATAGSAPSLLGIEGTAARLYFSRFDNMLKQEPGGSGSFTFEGRNKRPPTDPVNAVLSYLYGVLVKEFFVTVLGAGFDPYLGFLHRPRYGRPALPLDLMEEFRPIIADSVLLTLFNTRELQERDFIRSGAGVTITPDGRKTVIRAYERRMADEIRHPMFGYTISYRRVLSVQARLLGRVLSGELSEYPPFLTR